MKRLLVTGSRSWTDRAKILAELDIARAELGDDTVLVHGDARGVDRIAAHLWHCEWGLPVEDHPADWCGPCRPECKPNHRRAKASGLPKVCPAAGMYRNADMVALGADLLLAFILDESRGATGCVRLARKAGIPVRIFRASSALSVPIGGER
jgi:hypothetical protein